MKSANNYKSRVKAAPTGDTSFWGLFQPWLISFGPPLVVIVAGLSVFFKAIVRSIASTPHPELVYAILGVFFLAIGLCALALYQFQMETIFVNRWKGLESNAARRNFVESVGEKSGRVSYPALVAMVSSLPNAERQSKFEHELSAAESVLANKVALPNYMAGALVGLGLVGTFVGLLGTLEDLGAVFGSLSQAGDSSVNPTEVFANMVKKLQDPMKGMGTAFVSSLYGLLGSLIVGLCALSVSKSAITTVDALSSAERLHTGLRDDAQAAQAQASQPELALVAPTHSNHPDHGGQDNLNSLTELRLMLDRWVNAQGERDSSQDSRAQASEQRLAAFFEQMLKANWTASDEVVAHSQKALQSFTQTLQAQGDGVQGLSQQMAEQHQSLVHTVADIVRQANEERLEFRRDIFQVMEKNQADYKREVERLDSAISRMAGMTEKSVATIERQMAQQDSMLHGLPKTPYWKEAWGKVQQYLNKSSLEADFVLLARAVEAQTVALDKLNKQLAVSLAIDSDSSTAVNTSLARTSRKEVDTDVWR